MAGKTNYIRKSYRLVTTAQVISFLKSVYASSSLIQYGFMDSTCSSMGRTRGSYYTGNDGVPYKYAEEFDER